LTNSKNRLLLFSQSILTFLFTKIHSQDIITVCNYCVWKEQSNEIRTAGEKLLHEILKPKAAAHNTERHRGTERI
jgi:hypothetical protein